MAIKKDESNEDSGAGKKRKTVDKEGTEREAENE